MRPYSFRFLLTLLVAVVACTTVAAQGEVPGAGDDAGKTVIYRDTWGVPHIYAPTVEAGLYAMGWAQAYDRPTQLLENFAQAMGMTAKYQGPGAVQENMVVRMFDHYGVAKANMDKIRPEVRGHITAFVKGINDFYAAHPEDVPGWWGNRQVDDAMVVAFGRIFLYTWSIDDAFDELQRAGIEPGYDETERASNQFAVGKSRSAEGAPILYIDPHLGWWGASRFWEFRIHAGDLHGSGFTLAGFPYIGLGHNADLAWAMTTGGPDTADVYELTLNPDNPRQYTYDGEWRDMTSREEIFEVAGEEPQTHTLWFSHHGPIVAMRAGKAYAAKTAYADAVQVNEAWYEFNFAKDYTGAVKAMATGMLFPQNVMVADTSGNIYYQRTGRVPRRPEGYDWSKPVDGSTSATEWLGFHPSSEHLQVVNPPQGYMQNCNIPPNAMMVDTPFRPEDMPYYLTRAKSGYDTNPRGARAVELLSADESVTAEEARAYGLDVQPFNIDRWIEVLRRAHEAAGSAYSSNEDYVKGIEDMLTWDGKLERDSTAALKYFYWRQQLNDDHGRETVAPIANRIDSLGSSLGAPEQPVDLELEEQQSAITSFAVAMGRLKEEMGSLDAVYGDKFRVGRDDQSWPVGGGADGSVGTTTLRVVGYDREREDHTRWGRSGQTSTQIVVLTKPIKSWTAPPIGQSDRPESPHYDDQAEKVFSPRTMKPTWWMPEDLAANIESREVLENAP